MTNAVASQAGKALRAAGRPRTPDSARLLKAQADEKEAKAATAAFDFAVKRGEYMAKTEIKERDVARIAAVRRGVLSLPRQISARLGLDHLQEAEIKTLCRELLERFSRM